MIYLDNAATTFPKPDSVRRAVMNSFSYCANPGRSGHSMSIKAAEKVFYCRSELVELFGAQAPEKVIFTPSCTVSLNTVIKGVLSKGDHVVVSSLEHNSVTRPLERLASEGFITYSIADVFEGDDEQTLDSFRRSITKNTRLVVCTHASNVFGLKLPISRIGALCRYYGILFCVDAAQTAGVVDIDLSTIDIDYLCLPAHKGLYGTMGTGVLLINTDEIPKSLCEGGTGSGSFELTQPLLLPDKFESGTVNLPGIAALSAGVNFVKSKTPSVIFRHEMKLIKHLYHRLQKTDRVILYTKEPSEDTHVPLLSFNVSDIPCDEVARILDERFGVAVRSGLHCSPLAHRHFSTVSLGTVRVAPSAFTTMSDIEAVAKAIRIIAENSRNNYKKS